MSGFKGLIVTRPTETANKLLLDLQRLKINHFHLPLYSLECSEQLPNVEITPGSHLFFFSVKAVSCFVSNDKFSSELDGLKEIPCYAVGPTTARLLKDYGFKNVYFPEKPYNSQSLWSKWHSINVSNLPKQVVCLQQELGNKFIIEKMKALNIHVYECAIYAVNRIAISQDIDFSQYSHVLLTSALSVDSWLEALDSNAINNFTYIVMGASLAAKLQVYGISNIITLEEIQSDNIIKAIF